MIQSKYPKINIVIDKDLDFVNAKGFLRYEKDMWFLRRFFPKKLHHILDTEFDTKKRNIIIKEYLEDFYLKNNREIEINLKRTKEEWEKIEKEYFKLVDEIFDGYKWPDGEYKGVFSVFGMYPRWIDEKIFFLPCLYKPKNFSNGVIAHEMLHFLFFDFIKNKYKLNESSHIAGKEDKYVWKVSEVFNNVILNSKKFRNLLKGRERPYPGTEDIFKKMTAQWRVKKDMNWLLDDWLKK